MIALAGPADAQPEKVAGFVDKLDSKNKAIRLEALKQLGRQGTAAKDAVEAVGKHFFSKEDADEVSQTAAALAQIGPAAVPILTKAFKDARTLHPQHAAMALARMGPAAKLAVPALIEALGDRDPVVRAFAAQALGAIGDFSEDVTFALFQRVGDVAPEVRQMAGKALVHAGGKAMPGLVTILAKGTAPARIEAAGLLGMLGADGQGGLAELTSCLQSDAPQLRSASAIALSRIGCSPKDVMPQLLDGLTKEKNLAVQEFMLQSILSMSHKDMRGFLDELRKINEGHGWAGAALIARFGVRGVEAVRPLIKTLNDKDPGIRLGAVLALGQIGPDAIEALPKVQMLLSDPNPMIRAAAAQSVVKIDVRQMEMGLMQFRMALKQADFELARRDDRIGKGIGLPGDWSMRKAFFDPGFQAAARKVVQLHLMTSSAAMGGAFHKAPLRGKELTTMTDTARALLDKIGPESIPALVEGINVAGSMGIGFC